MTRFDRDTGLERVGANEFEGKVDRGWFVMAAPNGGYLASIILRALTMTVDEAQRSPRSLTVHYLRPAVVGPLTIRTTVERAGRSLSTLSARFYQGDTYMSRRHWPRFHDRSRATSTTMPACPRCRARTLRRNRPASQVSRRRYSTAWTTGLRTVIYRSPARTAPSSEYG
jgi:hypothetical protein